MSILSQKISEIVDEAIISPAGYAVWRGDIAGEQWKIIVDYNGIGEKFLITVKRRDHVSSIDENG